MAIDLTAPGDAVDRFLTDRHLATLTTHRPDGSPHVTPVGFTYDASTRIARVITFESSRKVRNLSGQPSRAAVCQVDGGRWLTLEGSATLSREPDEIVLAESLYAERYRPPKQRPDRVVIRIEVDRIMGRVG